MTLMPVQIAEPSSRAAAHAIKITTAIGNRITATF